MRYSRARVLILFWVLQRAVAQVSVEVVPERNQFLAGESMLVGVRVTNFSGQTLKLGANPDWLQVTVEGENGFVVERFGDLPVVEPFEVPSSARGTRWLDLQPYFNVGKPGTYRVTATVRIPELGLELSSKSKQVLVTSGAKIWEQDFGVPPREGAQPGELEVRKYALVQSLSQNQSRLYVRVSNRAETKVYKLILVGPMLAFSHPEVQLDRNANLHVLFQTGARTFTYVQVNPGGDLLAQQTHQYTQTRPRLRAREDGTICVSGGVRIKSTSDFPTPKTSETESRGP